QRRTVAELSDPYFASGSLILVARDSRLGTPGEAAGRKVAVVKGSVQEADVAELQPRAILITVGSLAAGAHAVRSGQADAFLYDDVAVLPLTLLVAGLQADRRAQAALPTAAIHHLTSIREERRLQIEAYLAGIRRDGMNLAESRAVIAAMRDFKAAFRAFTAEIARSPREVRDRYPTDIELYYRSSFLPRVRTLQSASS